MMRISRFCQKSRSSILPMAVLADINMSIEIYTEKTVPEYGRH